MSLTISTMQKVLFIFFQILTTLAQDFEIDGPGNQGYAPANTPVKDSLIADSGDQPILTFGDDTSREPNLSSQDQTWTEALASVFMVGRPGIPCTRKQAETSFDQLPLPNRFQRRSSSSSSKTTQLSSREESKAFCPNPETPLDLENADREKPPKKETIRPKRLPSQNVAEDMMRDAKKYGTLTQEPYEEACGSILHPICAPILPMRIYPALDISPIDMVLPARFCKCFFFHTLPSLFSKASCKGK